MPRRNQYRAPLPAQPTTAMPGSLAKILVMTARAARGEQLFHPRDSRPLEVDRAARADIGNERVDGRKKCLQFPAHQAPALALA